MSTEQENDETKEIVKKPEITPEMEALIEARADEKLKSIKEKLDGAYSARDAATAALAAKELKEREAEIARLREAGKDKEAYDIEIATERTRNAELSRQNVELTRDIELKSLLASFNFRNDSAREMAYREIVGQAVRNEQNVWVHKSGASMADFVKSFAAHDDNLFLFAQKKNSGGDLGKPKSSSEKSVGKLADLSQEEILKLAREGKLPLRK
jgi:hypothetical protein